MSRRTRKFLGTIAMLLFVCIYALLAMALAQARFIQSSSGLLQSIFYVCIGLGWILPIMPLVKWMEHKDHSEQG